MVGSRGCAVGAGPCVVGGARGWVGVDVWRDVWGGIVASVDEVVRVLMWCWLTWWLSSRVPW